MSPSPTPEPILATPTFPKQPTVHTKTQPCPILASPIVAVSPVIAASPIAPASPTTPTSTIVPATPISLVQAATLPIVVDHAAPTDTEFSWEGFDFQFGLNGGFLGKTAGNLDMPAIDAHYGPYPSLSAELQASLASTFDTTNFGGTGIIQMTPTTPLDPPPLLFQQGPGVGPPDAHLRVLPTQLLPFGEAELPAMDMAIPQLMPAPGAIVMPPVLAMEAVLPAPPVPAIEPLSPAHPPVPGPIETDTTLTLLPVQTTGRKRRHDEVDPKFIVTTKRAKIPKKRVEVEALTADKPKGKENR